MAKVIAGTNAVFKQKALDDLWEFNNWLIRPVTYSETLQEFITGDGYDNLEDYLRDNYNYEGERLEKAIFLIKQYYRTISPGDVKIGDTKLRVAGYVHAELFCPESEKKGEVLKKITNYQNVLWSSLLNMKHKLFKNKHYTKKKFNY